MESKILLWICIYLFGCLCGYFIKDNYTKPDNPINLDLDVKKNRFGNWKNRFKRK